MADQPSSVDSSTLLPRSEPPDGLLPVRPRGKHEVEAAGGWVVACGSYNEYGCALDEVAEDSR